MAYIYKITNDINGKAYIGKTLSSIQQRWREHRDDRTKRKTEHRPLYTAMNKYGVEHFHIEEIEECSADKANEREKYWITFYDTYHNGYNATFGGDGKPYVDNKVIISLWNQGKNIKEIHDITGYDGSTIKIYLDEYGVTSEQRKERGKDWNRKPVAMLDKNTGEILKTFSTTQETEKFLQKAGSRRHVAEVCKGKRETAYGYKWKYLSDL